MAAAAKPTRSRKAKQQDERDAAPAERFRNRIVDYRLVPASAIRLSPLNPRRHPDAQKSALQEAMRKRGITAPVLTRLLPDGTLELIDGELRTTTLADGEDDQPVPCIVTDLTEREAAEELAEHDVITLLATYDTQRTRDLAFVVEERDRRAADLLRLVAEENPALALLERIREMDGAAPPFSLVGDPVGDTGEEDDDAPATVTGAYGEDMVGAEAGGRAGALAARFGVPPFTVLDARQGYWQERKRAWLALGIESEIGRDVAGANIRFGAHSAMKRALHGEGRDFAAGDGDEAPALSIFDPVVCELVYRWFSPPGGRVLDPFAGGSVRGVLAAKTGRRYLGIDLRAEQVAANHAQWARVRAHLGGEAQPATLLHWMTRLYALTADPDGIQGDWGVWPEELREYLELLCLAHGDDAIRFAVAPGLLVADPHQTEKPSRPDTCLLMLSGGKDSVAAGMRAMELGYRIHAVHVRHVNRAYVQEDPAARTIAREMEWDFTMLTPETLPEVPGVSVLRDHYIWPLALTMLPFRPGAIAFGSYVAADGDNVRNFTHMEVAFRAFEKAAAVAFGADTRRLAPLTDEVEVLGIWRTAPQAVRDATSSCLTLAHHKPQHRRRCLDQGVPLDATDCGVCMKCRVKALVLARHYGHEYPLEYLNACRWSVREQLRTPCDGAYAHPRLRSWPGGAAERFCLDVCGLDAVYPLSKPPAREAVVTVRGTRQTRGDDPRRGVATVSAGVTDDPDGLTPVQWRDGVWVKRDDLFQMGDFCGGVSRDVWGAATALDADGHLLAAGLTTAGGTNSTQIGYVAKIARHLGIPCRVFVPGYKEPTAALRIVMDAGGEIVTVSPGHTSVLLRRAKDDAAARPGWRYIPYAHEVPESIAHTRAQCRNLPRDAKRLVMAVGCGMTLAGVLHGLDDIGMGHLPVTAVVVGADPSKRLDTYAPVNWRERVTLVDSTTGHHSAATQTRFWGVELDPWFEAKAAPRAEPGDIFWIICTRFPHLARLSADTTTTTTADTTAAADGETDDGAYGSLASLNTLSSLSEPEWRVGDARELRVLTQNDAAADLIFTCPPYFDLERYSDDARDLSNAPNYTAFREAYRAVIAQAVAQLALDRFAAIVVGDIRADGGAGPILPFVADTIAAFEDAGAALYNDAVLVTPAGTLPLRAGRTFSLSRKLGRQHQRLLVFVKGDARKAVAACGDVDFSTLPEGDDDAIGVDAVADEAS